MLRGIRRKWKQPVFYNNVYGPSSAADITRIIKLIVSEAKKVGLHIVGTVCDQGTNNVRAIKNLLDETRSNRIKNGEDCQDSTFCLSGMDIVPIYDVPHLLKGIRNNLLKYNLHFDKNSEKMVSNSGNKYLHRNANYF